MYIPEAFALDDRARMVETIRRHAFALLVTAPDGPPQATHLPVLYDADRGPHGTLTAHMARANPQWRDFAPLAERNGEALVIFQGPHAYVSPRWYAPGPAVPTWNYVAVHAYGVPAVIDDPAAVRGLLERLVAVHEGAADGAWRLDGQDEAFIARMIRGIVAFEIPVARIEAKAKLSQNRPAGDRRGVIAALAQGGDAMSAELAAAMEKASPES